MHDSSRKRLITVLNEASTDGNYTLQIQQWAKRNHDRVKIGLSINGEDMANRIYSILKSASLDYRHDAVFRQWCRVSARKWLKRGGIRSW